jgi:TRAP-type C4-dicarboxylate transport system permease small subunit
MLDRFDRALLKANRWTLIVILAAMATMVFVNVVLRFTTDRSLLWVEEVSRYLLIWLTFLGGGPVLRYGGHLGIDTLQEALPRHAGAIRGAIFAILLGFFALMILHLLLMAGPYVRRRRLLADGEFDADAAKL